MAIKRIDMKRHIKPKLIKSFTSLYLGKYCKQHNFSLTCKSFTNSGFSIKLDHYLFTLRSTYTQMVKYRISLVRWEIWENELSFSNLKNTMMNGPLIQRLMISSI